LCISLHTIGNSFATLPISSFGRQWSTARYPVFWQAIAWTARLWLLNCESQDCGLPGKTNRSRLRTAPSGDSQTTRVARLRGHGQPHPRIARYAADAGFSTYLSGDAGLAAVELLIRNFRFQLSLPPESLRVPKLKSFVPEAGRRHNKFNRNLRLAHEAGT
jgi:hypothetical protein